MTVRSEYRAKRRDESIMTMKEVERVKKLVDRVHAELVGIMRSVRWRLSCVMSSKSLN